jgi:hypothetical protein
MAKRFKGAKESIHSPYTPNPGGLNKGNSGPGKTWNQIGPNSWGAGGFNVPSTKTFKRKDFVSGGKQRDGQKGR